MSGFGDRRLAGPADRATWRLVEEMVYEIVPLSNLEAQLPSLPERAPVSITCSPVKGIDATLDLVERIVDLGHRPVPHLAARMVESRDHVGRIARRLREAGVRAAFVVGGDAPQPHGPFPDAASFLRALVDVAELDRIGIGSYPDGHPLIDAGALAAALAEKQAIIHDAGLDGWMTTQMCFDPAAIRNWAVAQRSAGIELDIHLGVAGLVDRAKLLTMGLRLGVGSSIRYLSKNRTAVGRLLTRGPYTPDRMLRTLDADLVELRITGLHVFTFNQIAATAAWQRGALRSARGVRNA
jgi:methylenetetrahydrofolate reductase (NADPH)